MRRTANSKRGIFSWLRGLIGRRPGGSPYPSQEVQRHSGKRGTATATVAAAFTSSSRNTANRANALYTGSFKSSTGGMGLWAAIGRFRQRRRSRPESGPLPGSVSAARRFAWFRLMVVILLVLSPVLFVTLGGVERIQRGLQAVAFFQITDLQFSGNSLLRADELRQQTGVTLHRTSMIGLDPEAIAARLLANPWLAEVSVERDFPSSLRISVVENRPIALLHADGNGGELVYLDGHGTPFLAVTPEADVDYPVITGVTAIVDPQQRQEALREALQFLRRAQGNNPHLPAQAISELHLGGDGSLVVYLVEYPFPIFLGTGEMSRKYSRLVEVLKELYKKRDGRELLSRVRYIDMEYLQDKVLVAQSDSG